MKQILALITGLLLSSSSLFLSQESVRPAAKLVHRYERACGYSCLQELAIDLGGVHANKNDDTVAVRFCSKESLAVALSTAAASPEYVISILIGSYGYTRERILFLRSEDCLGSDMKVAATEFWAIPKGAALPASVESFKSSQVQIDFLEAKGMIESGRKYKAALQKLPDRLRNAPDAVGVVVGYYYKNPSPAIKQRLREVEKLLEQSGLPKNRYFVRLAPWTGERSVDPPAPEPKYPSVFVVELPSARGNARK